MICSHRVIRNKILLVRGIAMKTMLQKRATVEGIQSSYQPSKAELEEDMSIDSTPEEVARALAPKKIFQVGEPTNRG